MSKKASKKPSGKIAAFARVREMQALCEQVEADNRQLKAFASELKKMQARAQKISDYYHSPQWLDDVAALEKQPDLYSQALNNLPRTGSWSVLAQDTIWDATQDSRALQLDVMKVAIKAL